MNKLGNLLTKTSFYPKYPVSSQLVSNLLISSFQLNHSKTALFQAQGHDPGKLHVLGALHEITQPLSVDSGADNNFIDSHLVETLNLPLVRLTQPISLQIAGDSSSTAGQITHETWPVQLHLGEHIISTSFLVTKTVHGLILGNTWLHQHSPEIDWPSYSIKFSSDYCKTHCFSRPTTVVGFPTRVPGPVGEDLEQVSAQDTLVDDEGIQSRLDHNTD
jgi:hypothetical protein